MDASGWDDRYRTADLVWSAEPNVFLPELVEDLEPGSALDLACGEGRNAIWLADQGWRVTGVDFSPVAIDKARTLAGGVPVTWEVADVTTYESVTPFDLVAVFYLHLPEPAWRRALACAVDAVAPGGRLIAVGHAVRNLTDGVGGPPCREILWSEESFDRALDGLTVEASGERLRPVEGAERDAVDWVVSARRPA